MPAFKVAGKTLNDCGGVPTLTAKLVQFPSTPSQNPVGSTINGAMIASRCFLGDILPEYTAAAELEDHQYHDKNAIVSQVCIRRSEDSLLLLAETSFCEKTWPHHLLKRTAWLHTGEQHHAVPAFGE